ncbi:hypothetical protein HRbin04_00608 [archaeon HR04]|nr:hypothetical protein HRbin04_00608 [archaeon HR04]
MMTTPIHAAYNIERRAFRSRIRLVRLLKQQFRMKSKELDFRALVQHMVLVLRIMHSYALK